MYVYARDHVHAEGEGLEFKRAVGLGIRNLSSLTQFGRFWVQGRLQRQT